MPDPSLENIEIIQLSTFEVNGGAVLHAIKKDDIGYIGFGEVYFSYINPKAIKAWKLHKRMTLNIVVPLGKVRFVFCDPQNRNNYRVEDIGEDNYVRLTVPPNIWFGFQGIAKYPSLITNIANLKHEENEVIRKEIVSFCYTW